MRGTGLHCAGERPGVSAQPHHTEGLAGPSGSVPQSLTFSVTPFWSGHPPQPFGPRGELFPTEKQAPVRTEPGWVASERSAPRGSPGKPSLPGVSPSLLPRPGRGLQRRARGSVWHPLVLSHSGAVPGLSLPLPRSPRLPRGPLPSGTADCPGARCPPGPPTTRRGPCGLLCSGTRPPPVVWEGRSLTSEGVGVGGKGQGPPAGRLLGHGPGALLPRYSENFPERVGPHAARGPARHTWGEPAPLDSSISLVQGFSH